MHATRFGFATRAIHHGHDPREHQGALVPPIHLSSTFAFPDTDYGMRCFTGEEPGFIYTRIANPTLALLEARIATLECGAAAVAFGSGMGAISATSSSASRTTSTPSRATSRSTSSWSGYRIGTRRFSTGWC